MKAGTSHREAGRDPKPRRRGRRILAWLTGLMLIAMLLAAAGAFAVYQHLSAALPQINQLSDYRPPIVSTVWSEGGEKIGEFFHERRFVIPLSEIPPQLVQAFIAAEDSRFFEHAGVDPVGIARATLSNLVSGGTASAGDAVGVFEDTVTGDGVATAEYSRGCYQFANSASADLITAADIGGTAYIVDNQTVAKTDNSAARKKAGKIIDVDANGVWVLVG